jgi:hypothetical protein
MKALELFLSQFHADELWAECLKCGRRYENEDHRCGKQEHPKDKTNCYAHKQTENNKV